jgi:chromosome segregation ATPase
LEELLCEAFDGPKCNTVLNLISPRIDRMEKDLNSMHTKARDFEMALKTLSLVNDDYDRRLDFLEKTYSEQKTQNTTILIDVDLLKAAVQDLREKMVSVVEGLNTIARKFDEQRQDLNSLSVKNTMQHGKRVKLMLTLVGIGAGIAVILNQLYFATTGHNILSTLLSSVGFVVSG